MTRKNSNKFRKTLAAAAVISLLSSVSAFAAPKVVTSIKPIHSLVSSVMAGIGEPDLLVKGASSPHDYALRPSEAAALQNADMVFWIGHELETFLEKPIETVATKAVSVELIDIDGIKKLKIREDAAFEGHDHDSHAGHDDDDDHKHDDHAGHDDHKKEAKHDDHHDHDDHAGHDDHKHDDHKKEAKHKDHDDHAGHKHDDHAGHDHDDHKKEAKHDDHDDHAGHKHDDHAGHDHDDHKKEAKHDDHGHHDHGEGAFDPHIWLDPENAKVMVGAIAASLIEKDPANKAQYEKNAAQTIAKLGALTEELKPVLAPLGDKPYIVFHDAYPYFEARFGLNPVGSITVSSEVAPGAERIQDIRNKIQSLSAVCVFSEPQFPSKLVDTVSEGAKVKTGVLDPLGASLEDGSTLYPALIRAMATSMVDCLGS